jgi:hypothetical protein
MAKILSRQELLDIADKAFEFCKTASGVSLYPYQEEFGRRICQSVILEDGDEITALFSRQSGKTETVSCVIPALCVLLPTLAQVPDLAKDERIGKYKDGFWVGIFAPNYELAGIMHSRMASRLQGEAMQQVLQDPEIGIELNTGRKALQLPNGSRVDSNSAGPQTAIEGKTYHLIVCEETQDISDYKIRKSIHPMGAATSATLIKIGTPVPRVCDFYEACERNRNRNLDAGKNDLKSHFEYDYTVAQQYNPRYEQYIKKEIERLGYDSDDFRMSYRLHWILERGLFITPDLLKESEVATRKTLKNKIKDTSFVLSAGLSNQDQANENLVAAIDIGRSSDSTIVTVAKVWWDNPIERAGESRFHTHILNWLEIQGDDHERQYPQILQFLSNFNLGSLVIDATGRGDPIYDRLNADLSDTMEVWPFIFSTRSKHEGYTILYQEIFEKRLTFPGSEGAKRTSKWRRFVKQTTSLEKHWKGKYMAVEAPRVKGPKVLDKPHDDYPDSLMMLCWLIHRKSWSIDYGESLTRQSDNLFDRHRRRSSRKRW